MQVKRQALRLRLESFRPLFLRRGPLPSPGVIRGTFLCPVSVPPFSDWTATPWQAPRRGSKASGIQRGPSHIWGRRSCSSRTGAPHWTRWLSHGTCEAQGRGSGARPTMAVAAGPGFPACALRRRKRPRQTLRRASTQHKPPRSEGSLNSGVFRGNTSGLLRKQGERGRGLEP